MYVRRFPAKQFVLTRYRLFPARHVCSLVPPMLSCASFPYVPSSGATPYIRLATTHGLLTLAGETQARRATFAFDVRISSTFTRCYSEHGPHDQHDPIIPFDLREHQRHSITNFGLGRLPFAVFHCCREFGLQSTAHPYV